MGWHGPPGLRARQPSGNPRPRSELCGRSSGHGSSVAPLLVLVGFLLLDTADLALDLFGPLALAALLPLGGSHVPGTAQRFRAAERQFGTGVGRRLAVVPQADLRQRRALRRQPAVDAGVVDVDRFVVVAADQLLR